MDIQKIKDYWIEEATESMQVTWHLFEKKDYSYSLFFAHLAIEKILKAIYVSRKNEHVPYIHNLQRLAEFSNIQLNDEQRDALIKITTFNLESRYPDEKRSFRKKCTEEFTKKEIEETEELFKWLKSILQ
ncbi:DNA-binding protein [Candidatus Desantisbacteria bacterium CG_4_10_14_3_um_filter_40_18]|uniref:DNA-binding protein n=2 Tax=unclassified Candidatus Desantisiibacteriota TaxID=3106372 RepID=A0A2M7P0G6_9BACT|nr:MAG: DNA-binding protein [Candidatus Desantisbacteria bacterium CG_4_10_14_3_um_filter_40_18]